MGGCVALLAGAAAAVADVDEAPGYAMGLEWVFRAERALLVLALATALLTFVVHIVLRGRVPNGISTTGGTWTDTTEPLTHLERLVADHHLTLHGGDDASETPNRVEQHDLLWGAYQASRELDGGVGSTHGSD